MNLEDADTSTQAHSLEPFSWRKWIGWDSCVLALPFVAALPLLILQGEWLWEQMPWRFFPLPIAAVTAYVMWSWRSSSDFTPARLRAAAGVFAVGTVLLLLAIWRVDSWTAYLACILCFFAWALGRWGDRPWHRAAAWSCVVLTTLPLPFGFDAWLHRRLIAKSAQYGSALMDVAGIPHLFAAGQMQLRDNSIDLLDCTNHVFSVFAMWALIVGWCVFRKRSLLHCLLLMIAAVVWYLVINSLQVFYIAYAWQSNGWDLSKNPNFAWLSCVAALIGLVCLTATDQLLKVLLKPSPLSDPAFLPVFAMLNTLFCWPRDPLEELGVDFDAGESEFDVDEEEEEESEFNLSPANSGEPIPQPPPTEASESSDGDGPAVPVTANDARMTRRVLVGLCFVVAGAGIPPWAALISGRLGLTRRTESKAITPINLAIDENTLPEQWKDWNRASFEQVSPHDSRWTFQWHGQAVIISLSPREVWNETPISINTGWRTNSVRLMRAPRPASDWPWAFCEMKNELGGLAYVFHSGMDVEAQPIEDFQEAQLATNQNVLGLLRDGGEAPKWSYQFQLSCESGDPLTSAELQELQDAFLFFRKQLSTKQSKQINEQPAGPARTLSPDN